MPLADRPRFVFLLALNGRSGTNYLFRLIRHHPEIAGADTPFWEDFLLHEAHHLQAYVDGVFGHWSEIAGELATPTVKEGLQRSLGEALCRFLIKSAKAPFVVTKTPSIKNVELIDRFFPDERLIILLRDGRDLVASGVQSFGWQFEEAAASWAHAADQLQVFCRQTPKERRLIVRFEDLVANPKATMDRVFRYVGADPVAFDWQADGLDQVIGSSTLRQTVGNLHWTPVDKPQDFNPVGRWQSWTDAEKHAFDQHAGRQLEAMRELF